MVLLLLPLLLLLVSLLRLLLRLSPSLPSVLSWPPSTGRMIEMTPCVPLRIEMLTVMYDTGEEEAASSALLDRTRHCTLPMPSRERILSENDDRNVSLSCVVSFVLLISCADLECCSIEFDSVAWTIVE